MNAPTMCPNCGIDSISPTFLPGLLSVWLDGELRTTSDLHAYRCANSHIFLFHVIDDRRDVEELDGVTRGEHISVMGTRDARAEDGAGHRSR